MAADGESKDFRDHERSYGLFTWMMKWGAIAGIIIYVLVLLIIAN